ncbi:MAG: hypothetical protein ALECFALPRED_006915 [Alectoria fallacina]|uniref:Uncharacterized protein n=1 Tax=Alectoria fallacina TaxID=1903189 RepID=A0A8H3I125_9LECA|nr:MAG: hypothetical protein ALECFALPRED_006915 [Alectoria fallacina]
MPGRQSTLAPSLKKAKPKRQKAKRSLNALAIAEQQNPTILNIRQSRLGKSEPEVTKRKRQEDDGDDEFKDSEGKRKRRKAGDKDRYGNEIEHGNDSSGNEWVIGQVESDDDSDLDSNEAMGASDEERFEGFGFRGSEDKTSRSKTQLRKADPEVASGELQEVDLRENDDEVLGSDEESDGLGEDAVDLATMLDASDDGGDLSQDPAGQSSESLDGSGSDAHSDIESSAEEEESMLSYSGDEDDARNSTKLASLQALISTMNEGNGSSCRNRAPVDAQESTSPSEFGLNSKRKLTIADMIPSVTDPGLRKSLKLLADNEPKPTSKRGGIPKKLDVPLPKRQQDRLDRAAAYEQSKETLNRWINTVKHNRRAEHLTFPLKGPSAAAAPGSQPLLPTSHSQPLTDLESTIQNILRDSGLAGPNGKHEEEQMQVFEELKTNKIPLEEVQARRAELRRARELLFREEIRAKRIKKIKSKSYRKVHRKERERDMQLEKDALTAAGVDDSESEKERQDRRRAEERIGARHRESKWAKGIKDSGRAKWDEDARGEVMEMARRGEDLRRRIEGKPVAGDEDASLSSESESDEEDDIEDADTRNNRKFQDRLQRLDENGNEISPNDKGSRLASMDFMKKAEARRKARNDADVKNLRRDFAGEETPSEEDGQEGKGRKSYGPMKKSQISSTKARQSNRKAEKNEFEERPGSDDEDEDRDGAKIEDVDIVVDNYSVQIKANRVEEPSLSDKHRRKPYETQEASAQEASENPWLMGSKKDSNASRRRIQNPDAGAIISNTPAANLIPPPAEKANPRSALKGARQAEASRQSVQPSPKASKPDIALNDPDSDNESDNAENLPFVLRNQDLVRKAFAGDEVVANFEQGKRAIIQDEDEKVVDNTLPGWGSWTGAGIGKKAERRNKGKLLTKIPGVKAEKRQDAKLDRVIINEKKVKKNGKYLANSLPYPFETRQQYERSLRLPVGPEWTTKETFQGMTKPRVMMKPGVIAPMSKPMI